MCCFWVRCIVGSLVRSVEGMGLGVVRVINILPRVLPVERLVFDPDSYVSYLKYIGEDRVGIWRRRPCSSLYGVCNFAKSGFQTTYLLTFHHVTKFSLFHWIFSKTFSWFGKELHTIKIQIPYPTISYYIP